MVCQIHGVLFCRCQKKLVPSTWNFGGCPDPAARWALDEVSPPVAHWLAIRHFPKRALTSYLRALP